MLIRNPKSNVLLQQERAYLEVRKKEARLYPDEVVHQLPEIDAAHDHCSEWQIRKQTLNQILQFVQAHPEIFRVLDLGCGNGWMSNALQQSGLEVVGVDINAHELEQASRLFPEVSFYELDILGDVSLLGRFDLVIISAALQYFEFPDPLIQKIQLELLHPYGYLLIADTHFYSEEERASAKKRSQHYYSKLDSNEMSKHYFHHEFSLLNKWKATPIFQKTIFQRLYARLRRKHHPFQLYLISNGQ